MPQQSFSEQLWAGLADAIADIREKAVEEPWFGRVVTERGEASEWPQAIEPQQMPEGLTGEILSPEPAAAHEAAAVPRLEYGTVLHQESEREGTAQWPEAREIAPAQTREPERDRSPEPDIER